jgi:hypothetical protein
LINFDQYNFLKPKVKTMKKINKTSIISASLMIASLSVSAHDPSMHAQKAEKADCTSYTKMMQSDKKMDMTDPVMMAMMKKCKNQVENHDQHEEKKADMECADMTDSSAKTEEQKHGDMKEADHKNIKDGKCGDDNNSDK